MPKTLEKHFCIVEAVNWILVLTLRPSKCTPCLTYNFPSISQEKESRFLNTNKVVYNTLHKPQHNIRPNDTEVCGESI